MKSIISVNRQAIKQGKPAISVKRGGKTLPATSVDIHGPSEVVYDPDKTRQPRVWIQTEAELTIHVG